MGARTISLWGKLGFTEAKSGSETGGAFEAEYIIHHIQKM